MAEKASAVFAERKESQPELAMAQRSGQRSEKKRRSRGVLLSAPNIKYFLHMLINMQDFFVCMPEDLNREENGTSAAGGGESECSFR